MDPKIGLDDYLVAEGAEAFMKLVDEDAEEYLESRELHKLNEKVIYVHNHSVFEVETGERMTAARFVNEVYSHLSYDIKREDQTPLTVWTATKWMKWPGRATARRYVYEPGQARILPEGVNDWNGWGVPTEFVKKGDTKLWSELLRFQFGAGVDWFEKRLAYPLQHPGTKMITAVLNWGATQGTGKDLLIYIAGLIYGENWIKVKESNISDTYNQLMERRQFVSYEELSGGAKNRRTLGDIFKTLITQKRVNINPKFLAPYTIRDCMNHYASSNRSDPIYIEPTDRRWFVNEAPSIPKPKDWYTSILNHYGTFSRQETNLASVGALFWHLLNEVDVSDFDLAADAPTTTAKREVIALSQSDPFDWAKTLHDSPDVVLGSKGLKLAFSLMTQAELLTVFKDKFKEGKRTTMLKVLKEAGVRQANNGNQIRNCGAWGKPHLYIVRKHEELESMSETQLAKRFLAERKDASEPFNAPQSDDRRFV